MRRRKSTRKKSTRKPSRRRIIALLPLLGLALLAVVLTVAPPDKTSSSPAESSPAQTSSLSPTTWDSAASPEYYRIVGQSHITWQLPAGTTEYGKLDAYGRATYAHANVTLQLVRQGSARERADTSGLYPSGWGHNAQVSIPMPDDNPYHGEFWNRSHLLAKSLGGLEVIENLVTGTRTQNVGSNAQGGGSGGMGYCESLARDWLERHPTGTLLYAATPAYLGSELVCRSVFVDMLTSDGSVDLRVEVYNTALGFGIDYETGEFWETGEQGSGLAAEADTGAQAYVLNQRTMKFHRPACEHANSISHSNRRDVVMTREEVLALGYDPCGVCQP